MKTKKTKVSANLPSFKMIAVILSLSFFLACEKQESYTPVQEKQDLNLEQGTNNLKKTIPTNGKFVIEPALGKTVYDVVRDVVSINGTLVRIQQQLNFVVVQSNSATFKSDMILKSSTGTITPSYDVNMTPEVNATLINENEMVAPMSPFVNANPLYWRQWSHQAINSEGAWQLGYKGNGAVVAVVDGGFFPNHPDIKDNVNIGLSKNFVDGETLQRATEGFGHGTHCAGIIAARNNTIGTIGVAPEAQLILVKVLADVGFGTFEDVAAGIVYAADLGVDIISLSLGANIPRTSQGETNDIRALINFQNKAIKYAESKGVTVIVAAQNDSQNPSLSGNLVTPVGAPGSIGVSALAPRGWFYNHSVNLDEFASYSNWGTTIIDLSGSGGDFKLYPQANYQYDMIISPSGSNAYYYAAGTSMATPQVAGVAALIVGKYGKMTPAELKTRLMKCADDLGKTGRDEFYGQGRVNAYNAVK